MTLAPGAKLGTFEIVSLLGAGGMGEVYRAKDTRLGRDVALKVIAPELASQPEQLDRFRREAKALAALDHPNIVTVFSVEEADGVHFLTMQLVDGKALDAVIPEGGLPFDRIVHVATAIADALTAAHERHIVHRDLKPANVIVAVDGRVKVLDFGLAKELAGSGDAESALTLAAQTHAGVIIGTPAYMSPEQITGRAVDHRTDIFSFGVILYQMASGRRPFAGASSLEVTSAILRDTPPALTDVRGDLPADLARLIRRCIEKDPHDRIQTARDVANECRELVGRLPPAAAAARSSSGITSGAIRRDEGFWIAVLPFKSTGAHPDVAAFADGMCEEIVTGLSRFLYLRIVARSTTIQYASTAVDFRAVGRDIGARYLLEGSVRQSGSQLRVTAQLVDAASGANVWADTYNRPFDPQSLFDLQDDLVSRIVGTLADSSGALARNIGDELRGRPRTE